MDEKLNIELVKMQEELNLLDIAIKHIGKAETLSKVVVEASRGIPKRVEKHLNEVLGQYNSFLTESKTDTKEQIDGLTVSHQNLVENANKTIEEYKTLAEETEKRSVENHKQAIDSYIAFVNKTYNQQEERLDDITLAHDKQIKKAEDTLTDYKQLAEATEIRSAETLTSGLEQYREFLEKNRADFKQKVDEIKNINVQHLDTNRNQTDELITSHQSSVDEMNKVIDEYRELGQNIEKESNERLDKTLEQYRDYLKKAEQQTSSFASKLTDLHAEQLDEVKHLAENSTQLSTASKELMKRIEDIDFPQRLSKIDEKIDTRLDQQDKELKLLKIGVAVLGVISIASLVLLVLQ